MNLCFRVDDGGGMDAHPLRRGIAESWRRTNLARFFGGFVAAEAARTRCVYEAAGHGRFRHFLAFHVSDTLHANGVYLPGFYFNFNSQLIAGNHRAAEAGALNAGKKHQLVFAILHFCEQQRTPCLRDSFYDQHAGHYRRTGEVTGEKWLVDSDVLDCHNALLASKVDDPIDQQERKTVRKDLAYFVNVQGHLRGSSVVL